MSQLFLTATPHNGYSESFSALLELLDNQRFAGGTSPDRKQLDAVMVRRLKSSLPPDDFGQPRFPQWQVKALEVDYPDEEKQIHAALQEYANLRTAKAADTSQRVATEFVLKTLKKRLFSSPAAFARTLQQHEQTIQNKKRRQSAAKPSPGILQRQIDRVDEEYWLDDEAEDVTNEVIDAASLLWKELSAEEATLLKQMKQWAEQAKARLDAKAKTLIAWLHENIRPNGQWSDTGVIIFTEYRATQNWLFSILAGEGFTGNDRLMTMYGGMDRDKREEIKAAFQTDPTQSPVRILLATDAASEGIDLQNHCSRLIHYEIPWNPNRLEQRNGRVDRHGQKAKEVLIYHFVGKGYQQREAISAETKVGDLEADLEFLMRAVRKVETIREDLGKVGPVIAQQVEEAMLGRRRSLDTKKAEEDAEPIRRILKFERDLKKQITHLMDQLHETKRELRLAPENIQKVVEIALELAKQPPLIPANVEGIWPDPRRAKCPVFHLPALTGSWALCAEGLAHPMFADQVRPFTFDHNLARGREDVVLVHLNHRLVQMSLRLLREEVWSLEGSKRLHRIVALIVPDSVLRHPAVIAHARLVVIGGDRHRLHEEVIFAGGQLIGGCFQRFGALREMQDALNAATDREPSETVKQNLLNLQIADSLRAALEARMKDRAESLQRTLGERAEKEATNIETVMTELLHSIQAELAQLDDPTFAQEYLPGFAPVEREQFERNLDALRLRVRAMPDEIEREKTAIRARFADPQPRMFPVAVTYLVPEMMAGKYGHY